jgi:hypothetical protein
MVFSSAKVSVAAPIAPTIIAASKSRFAFIMNASYPRGSG